MKHFMIAAAALCASATTPAKAAEVFDISINGTVTGTLTTIQCNESSAPNCMAAFQGSTTTDPFLEAFNHYLGEMLLNEGDNPFSYGFEYAPEGAFYGTINNSNGFLTGRDLQFQRIDSSCHQGEVGCRYVSATASTFNVVGGIPEPGTWAMMLIGFGAVGYSMRRRKVRDTVGQAA